MRQRTFLSTNPLSRSLNNPLLIKDELGHTKQASYELPPLEFIYGKPLHRDNEGAKEITSVWNYHRDSPNADRKRDFRKLNKLCLNTGAHTAKDVYEFRKTHDASEKMRQGTNRLSMNLPEEEFRYGVPNRPPTPFKYVIGNVYGLEAEISLKTTYQKRFEEEMSKPSTRPKANKSSYLSSVTNKQKLEQITLKNKKQLFKLTKFKQVAPRTETHLHKLHNNGQQQEEIKQEDTQPIEENQQE